MKSVPTESMNTGAKKLEYKSVDEGLSLLGKKIKKEISSIKSSGTNLTDN